MRYKLVFRGKRGSDMTALIARYDIYIDTKDKLKKLREKVLSKKQREDLRHIPNFHDIKIANENAKDLEYETYKSL